MPPNIWRTLAEGINFSPLWVCVFNIVLPPNALSLEARRHKSAPPEISGQRLGFFYRGWVEEDISKLVSFPIMVNNFSQALGQLMFLFNSL